MKSIIVRTGISLVVLVGIIGCVCQQSSRWAKVKRFKAPRHFKCPYNKQVITIDGRLNEAAWKKACVIEKFWLTDRGPLATTQTKVLVLWDKDNIYLGAVAEDKDVLSTYTDRDAHLWGEDVIEYFFKPREDSFHYYEFEFSPKGVIFDAFWPSGSRVNLKLFADPYDPDVEAAAKVDGTVGNPKDQDDSWTVEVRIPFSAFKETCPSPKPGDKWLFAACRYDYSAYLEKTETSSSARLPTGSFHQYQGYDYLEFVK